LLAVPARTPTPLQAEVDDFSAALDDFMRAVRRAQGRAVARGDGPGSHGLTLSQYRLVEPLVGMRTGLGVTELALQAGVSVPTATRTFDFLARDGLVVRDRGGEGDGRAVRIRLTPAGARKVRAKRSHIERLRAEIHASLPADVREHAAEVLAHLAQAVEGLR
jgi:DNA-binding MarR family transcriptional regulator